MIKQSLNVGPLIAQNDLQKTSKRPQKEPKRLQKDLKKTSKRPQKDLTKSLFTKIIKLGN